jgi:L-serine/L-threonine ammonia-lyase
MGDLHIQTPLLESTALSHCTGTQIWLKMEPLQPSGSFKLRGVGRACSFHRDRGVRKFISSSGGNAGIAVAYCGKKLHIPVTVVVPTTTPNRAVEIIRQEGAEVIVHGESWQEAHGHAQGMTDADRVLIHPFDDPLLWEGHATLIDEVAATGLKPEAILCSVGGGGLLCGVLEGLHRNQLDNIPVYAVETQGAASFAAALSAQKVVELDKIDTVATSLGAKKVCARAFSWSSEHEIFSQVVSDVEAVEACLSFVSDHRVVVEPACGAALAPLYRNASWLKNKQSVLAVVCGGVGASYDQLIQWRQELKTGRQG